MTSLSGTNGLRSIKSIAIALALSAAFVVAPASRVYAQSDSMPSKTIDLNLNNAPVRQALNVLFQGAGLNYTMDPGVSGYVNVNLRAVSFETALKAVLKSASPPLVAVKDPDTGVYYIKVKDSGTSGAGGPGMPGNPSASPTMPGMGGAASPSPAPFTAAAPAAGYQGISMAQFETITLKFLDPTELSQLNLGTPIITLHSTTSTAGAKTTGGASFGGAAGASSGASTGGGGMQQGGMMGQRG